jgi:D-alanyl-lipoteichoic acid acyltransferase DltB (MBOAT superfamily)
MLLLLGSYLFYAWADWKILPLLIISTLIFYGLGLAVFQAKNHQKKNLYAILGIILGIAVLLYFKYMNFFISSFQSLFENVGFQTNWHTFKILIPIGISFYTFRLLSYVIDIQREKYEPEKDLIAFAAYVAFFPCILSGPIDRPNTLIPQLKEKRKFDYLLAVDGLRQILWGAFKKLVVADNIAPIINQIFESHDSMPANRLLLGAVLYTFQMYGDFSGYTDMATGLAKLLGFRVTKNFNFPFFAQNIADFWRRWHISLTSWLTDYIFMPLNIKWRDWGKSGTILAIIINFVICGLWHGANWTFVLWGFYHGLLFIPIILLGTMFKKTKITTNRWGIPTITVFGRMALTFFLVMIGLIIFRSENISQAFNYIARLFSSSLFSIDIGEYAAGRVKVLLSFIAILVLLCVEWLGKNGEHALSNLGIKQKWLRYVFYYFILFFILVYKGAEQQFIYFQF